MVMSICFWDLAAASCKFASLNDFGLEMWLRVAEYLILGPEALLLPLQELCLDSQSILVHLRAAYVDIH